MVIRLTEQQKEEIKNKFSDYVNKNITLGDLEDDLGIDATTLGKYFTKWFGDEYTDISRIRSYKHSIKLSNSKVLALFEKYKGGTPMKELAGIAGVKRGSLAHRMLNLIGGEYSIIAKKRKVDDGRVKRQKVSDEEIKMAFEKYKTNNISLTAVGNKVGLAESSLIARFKFLFGEKYKKISLKRRDERKVLKKDYIDAFKEYETTNISLIDLANRFNIRISTIRPRFLNLFGDRYIRIAKKKADGLVLNQKGQIAEFLAREYLKLLGITIEDVRGKAILKGTLKRPDFVVNDTFIEIKSYFITFINSRKRFKGYTAILDDYLGKETKDGIILTKGMIISMGGFSDNVWEKAIKDGVTLIDYRDLKRTFEDKNRYDLLGILEDLRGPID